MYALNEFIADFSHGLLGGGENHLYAPAVRRLKAELRAEPALTNSSIMIVSKSSISYSINLGLYQARSPFIMP